MPTLEINGRRVQVDDSFLSLPPEQQQSTVEEIARSMGMGQEAQAHPAPQGTFSELRDAGMIQQTPGNEDLWAPSVPQSDEPDPGAVPSVPGVLGDIQNAERAFSNAMTQGATFGFADEIAAGVAAPFRAAASGQTLPQAFEGQIGDIRALETDIASRNPIASTAGNIAGAVGTGVGLARGGVSLMNGARPTATSMALRGAGEGALYGAAHGFGSGDDMQDRIVGAGIGAATGGLTGGIVGGVSGALANRAAQSAVPTLDDLSQQATALYNTARQSGAQLPQPQASQMAANMRQIASSEGIITPQGNINESYAKIGPLIRSFDDYAQGNLGVDQMQAVRRLISNALKSTDADERRIAMSMMDEFHRFLDPIAPEISQANQLYSRMKTGELIDRAIELAESRAGAFSGSGFENALRTEFRALERQIIKGQLKGLTQAQKDAITAVAQGGPVENAMRTLGKLAPTGIVSMGITSGVPYYMGNSIGGPTLGAGAAAATMGAGFAGRQAATNMTLQNARIASALGRSGGVPLQLDPARRAIAQALIAGGSATPQSALRFLEAQR